MKNTKSLLLCFALIGFLGPAPLSHAQSQPGAPAKRPISPIKGLEGLRGLSQRATPRVEVRASHFTDAATQQAILEITCDVGDHCHIYSLTQQPKGPVRSKILLQPNDQFKLAGPFEPLKPPKITPPDLFPVPVEEHTGSVTWRAPIQFSPGVDPGSVTIAGEIDGQVCTDDGSCMFLRQFDTTFKAVYGGIKELAVPAGSATSAPSQQSSAGSGAANVGTAVAVPTSSGGNLLKFLVFGFFGGMILNLMPCVLPVIGLKIMSFAQQAGESSSRVLWLNLCFVAGLVTVFMGLAALAAFAGWGWGAQFQRPEFAIALALIVFVFALSFLGIWEIPIPGFVGSGKAAAAAQKEGAAGAYAKGVLTTLLATPCSGPLIGVTLAWAVVQPKPVIFAVFLSMGLGMGSPFLLLGMSPGLLKFIPKPGAWMDTFKQVMGFVLLATVVWVFTFLNEDYFVPTLALLFASWAACWWIGRIPLTADLGDKIRGYLVGVVFAGVMGFIAFSVLGPSSEEPHWREFSPATLAELRDNGTTVLVDFTADW